MAGLHGGSSPSVVKTELDAIFYATVDRNPGPEFGSVTDELVLHQESASNGAVITEVFKGPGLWQEKAELANVYSDTALVGDSQTFTIKEWANSVDISKNLFDDDMHSVVGRMIENMGAKARATMEKEGMGLFRNGFGTTLTNDAVAWFSNSHSTLNGDTVDNLETAALSESQLNTMIIALMEQVDQSGTIMGHQAACLLVPPALYKTAVEITDSELRSGTANNDDNVYSSKYGIYVKQNNWLGAAAGDNGSDTAYFLLSRDHQAYRWERQGIQTTLVDWKFERNNNYVYKGSFREQYGVGSYEGTVASNGTT